MANNIYISEGSAFTFKSTGGSALWTPTSLANGAGRVSTQLDLGAAPRPKWYRWVLVVKFTSGPGTGTLLRPYLVEASTAATTYQDGIIGVTDAALNVETALQHGAKLLGPCPVQVASTAFQVWSGKCRIFPRYVSMALWNATGVALSGTATDHEFRLEPIFDQVQ